MKLIWKILGFIGIVIVLASVHMLGKGIVKMSNYQENKVIDTSLIDWGFGVEPRQSVNTLKIIKPLKLAFDTRLFIPPKPDDIYSYYYATITPKGEVAAVVGLADFSTWDECINIQNKLVKKLGLKLGEPETSKRQGKYVKIFSINIRDYGDIRVVCQPLKLKSIKARLIKIYNPSNELISEMINSNLKKAKELEGRIDSGKSILLKK
jgi:hypothetical protein